MISPRVAAVSFALAAALPAFAASYDGEAPFEKAAETSTVKLGPSDAAPPAEKEIRCFYFSAVRCGNRAISVSLGFALLPAESTFVSNPGATFQCCPESVMTVTVFLL